MKKLIPVFFTFTAFLSQAQNVGIGTANPVASAKLEVQSTNSGVLIPRMTAAQRDIIANPATGLLVFVTDDNNFYFNTGTPASPSWISLNTSFTGWGTSGNTGTNPAVNFIGTTDANNLTIKANNQRSGYLQVDPNPLQGSFGNTSFGYKSLNPAITGSRNTAIGNNSMFTPASATTASFNTAVGYQSLQSNMANSNTAVGDFSLASNTTGTGNTALGAGTLGFHKSGDGNVAIGKNALQNDTTGNFNVGIGEAVLSNNKNGSHNIGVGLAALGANTTGNNNIALGNGALVQNTIGENNIAIGRSALKSNIEKSGLIAIGDSALFNGGLFDIAIGNRTLKNNANGGWNIGVGNNVMSNNSGYENIGFGTDALRNNAGTANIAIGTSVLENNGQGLTNQQIEAAANIAIGFFSMNENSLGSGNVAISSNTLRLNKTGSNNTAIGFSALQNTTNGMSNIGIGSLAFYTLKHGEGNIGLGSNSLTFDTTQNNSIAIGFNSRVDCSNCLILGSVKDTNNANSNSNIGIGTTNPKNRLHIHNNEAANSTIFQITHANTGLTTTDGLLVGVNTAQEAVFNNQENAALKFATNNTVRMTIAAGGDITLSGKIINEAWKTPTLNAGWNNYGGGYVGVSYYKDKENRVHLRGLLNNGAIGSTIFVLDPLYRPVGGTLMFNVNNGNAQGRIDIDINGNVVFTVGPATGTWLSLDGVSFRAD